MAQNKDDNPLKSSDGMGEPLVAAEPNTTFDERTTGVVHPWAIGTDADPRDEASESELVGVHVTGDGETEDQMVATPVGAIEQPEGHENPGAVNPNLVGDGVVVEGVSESDQRKAQIEANGKLAAHLDAKEETKRAKDAAKAEDKN